MLIRHFAFAAALAAFALAAVSTNAYAQKKLYRWVDQDGKVRYTDQLPPEAAKDRREELNSQGITVKTNERALTPEEKAAKEAEEQRLAKEQEREEEVKKRDAMLTGAYPTEADLKRAYKERFDLVEKSLESARAGIRSQENSQAQLLAHAANLEREGKPVDKKTVDSIAAVRAQVDQQREYLARREAEQVHLQKEYDATLARYRELKGIAPPASASESAPKTEPAATQDAAAEAKSE